MILDRIHHWARLQAGKTALIHNDTVIGYALFAQLIGAARRYFAAQGLSPGGVAVVAIDNLADAWIMTLALRAIGLTTICVASIDAAEALQLRGVSCIVLTEREQARPPPRPGAFVGAKVIVAPVHIYRDIDPNLDPPPDQAASGGHILYTSGTTGNYKKVVWEPEIEDLRNARMSAFRNNDRDTLHHVLHFGLWTAIGFDRPMAVWHTGGGIVIDQTSDQFGRLFRHGVTKATLVPSMFNDMLAGLSPRNRPGQGFELSSGGGFLTEALVERVFKSVGPRVTNFYGATECAGIASLSIDDVRDMHWLVPAADRRIEIVDDAGLPCADGVEGEMRVQLIDSDARRYLDDDATSAEIFRDGCFHPGDMAVRRADGRIRILGRSTDVLNVAGRKIAIGPLEQAVQRMLQVDDVCLLSGLNRQGFEELVIVVEAAAMPPRAALERVVAQVGAFERVRFEVVPAFPRTEAGMRKLKRAELRKWVFGGS